MGDDNEVKFDYAKLNEVVQTKLRETDEQQEIAVAGDANEERLSDVEQRLDVEVMRTAGRVEILRSQRVCGDHPRSTEKSNNNGGYEQLPGR
ncbi:hypothetical protein L917_14097 [Phytophthora nicotianae]|uniref:Uncharacterized protein n=1 Tax=Phytophthora nicotianae TaxID=4792 RepID=W2KN29_PHYNI|nr:hypothetical protein L917_14097 [Phytophthora nicotianae]